MAKLIIFSNTTKMWTFPNCLYGCQRLTFSTFPLSIIVDKNIRGLAQVGGSFTGWELRLWLLYFRKSCALFVCGLVKQFTRVLHCLFVQPKVRINHLYSFISRWAQNLNPSESQWQPYSRHRKNYPSYWQQEFAPHKLLLCVWWMVLCLTVFNGLTSILDWQSIKCSETQVHPPVQCWPLCVALMNWAARIFYIEPQGLRKEKILSYKNEQTRFRKLMWSRWARAIIKCCCFFSLENNAVQVIGSFWYCWNGYNFFSVHFYLCRKC